MAQGEHPEDRRAKIRIGLEEIMQLLGLPEGLRIRAIDKENDPIQFVVHVQGDLLPVVDPNVRSPELSGRALVNTVIHNRKPYRRWAWELDDLDGGW